VKPSTIKKALKATLALTGFLLTTATFSVASTLLTIPQAKAELFMTRDFGVALNTNNNYRLIDGSPRVSTWGVNINDNDQHFDWIGVPGNNLNMFKSRSTGKCLNAYRKWSGAEVNTWACNSNDQDQIWNFITKGDGFNLLRLNNTNLCLTADMPVGNASIIALRDCAYFGPNGTQDWRGSNYLGALGGRKTIQEKRNFRYEVVLNSLRAAEYLGLPESEWPQIDEAGAFGHSWITLVKKWDDYTVTYVDGREETIIVDRYNNYEFQTVSASGYGISVPQYDDPIHRKWAKWHLDSGESRMIKSRSDVGVLRPSALKIYSGTDRVLSYMRRSISYESFRKYASTSFGGLGNSANGCTTYDLIPTTDNSKCSCGTFALKLFKDVANVPELDGVEIIDYGLKVSTPGGLFKFPIVAPAITPTGISYDLDRVHGWSDWNRRY
jgi:hypothetical protein